MASTLLLLYSSSIDCFSVLMMVCSLWVVGRERLLEDFLCKRAMFLKRCRPVSWRLALTLLATLSSVVDAFYCCLLLFRLGRLSLDEGTP